MNTMPAAAGPNRFAYHVVAQNGSWKVTIPGDSVALTLHRSKGAAIARAQMLARAARTGVVVHSADGQVEWESFEYAD